MPFWTYTLEITANSLRPEANNPKTDVINTQNQYQLNSVLQVPHSNIQKCWEITDIL